MRRMARPTVIRNEAILEAARQVFLERGILATSAEVAQRAGVSEGSLFKRFKTKADLFRAAMGLDIEDAPAAVSQLASRVGAGTVEENLAVALLDAIGYMERIFPIAMMSWSNPKVNDCLPFGNDEEPPPLKLQRLLAEYLEAEQALGRVRPLQAKILSRALMGTVSSYVFSELVVARRGLEPMDREAYVREYVMTMWAGMAPVVSTPSRGARASLETPAVSAKPPRSRATVNARTRVAASPAST